MNASVLKRTLAIAAAVAVPWAGWSVWSSRREAAAKEALAAEIRAEMAARPADPDRRAGRRDATEEYEAILRRLDLQSFRDTGFIEAMTDAKPWDGRPKAVTKVLALHEPVFTALDLLADRAEPAYLRPASDWLPWIHLNRLVQARGRMQATSEDWAGLLRTVRLQHRIADDLLASVADPDQAVFLSTLAIGFEGNALNFLEAAAVHPSLPEGIAREGLALLGGAWAIPGCHDAIDALRRHECDRLLLEMAGEEAEEALQRLRPKDADSVLERAGNLFRGSSRPVHEVPAVPPRADALRRIREIAARSLDAASRRDGAALRPGGDIMRQALEDQGGGWRARDGFAYPWLSCQQWSTEAVIPVLRAAFAVRLHEMRTGRSPASLEEIVPSILESVPRDAWTGEPVRYERREDGGWTFEAGSPAAEIDVGGGASFKPMPYRLERTR